MRARYCGNAPLAKNLMMSAVQHYGASMSRRPDTRLGMAVSVAGLMYIDVEEKIGLSSSTLRSQASRAGKGERRQLSPQSIAKISEYLGVSEKWLSNEGPTKPIRAVDGGIYDRGFFEIWRLIKDGFSEVSAGHRHDLADVLCFALMVRVRRMITHAIDANRVVSFMVAFQQSVDLLERGFPVSDPTNELDLAMHHIAQKYLLDFHNNLTLNPVIPDELNRFLKGMVQLLREQTEHAGQIKCTMRGKVFSIKEWVMENQAPDPKALRKGSNADRNESLAFRECREKLQEFGVVDFDEVTVHPKSGLLTQKRKTPEQIAEQFRLKWPDKVGTGESPPRPKNKARKPVPKSIPRISRRKSSAKPHDERGSPKLTRTKVKK